MKLLTRSFLFNLFREARFSHAKKYLIKSLLHNPDSYESAVLSKDKTHAINIWALKQVKHRVAYVEDDLYLWEFNKEIWLGNLDHIHGLHEYLLGEFEEIYPCDYRDKVVLDVGGYIGDSARFFLREGARRVIVYEPVKKNLTCLEHNLKVDCNKVMIIPKGVGKECGEMTIASSYPEGHIGFGCQGEKYAVKVDVESFHAILSTHKVDIAKIDCEGNEKYLLEVEDDLIREIPYWMIEVHDPQLVEKLHTKFAACGFKVREMPVPPRHMGVFHYQLL